MFLCPHLLPDYSEEQEGQGNCIIYYTYRTYIHTLYIHTYIQEPTGICSLKLPPPPHQAPQANTKSGVGMEKLGATKIQYRLPIPNSEFKVASQILFVD